MRTYNPLLPSDVAGAKLASEPFFHAKSRSARMLVTNFASLASAASFAFGLDMPPIVEAFMPSAILLVAAEQAHVLSEAASNPGTTLAVLPVDAGSSGPLVPPGAAGR